jgi:HK97 family phage prohead protease
MTEIRLSRSSGLLRADTTGRTVFGLVVPYNEVATVDDGRGPYRESFAPRAFERSVRERGHKVKLHAQHDTRRLPIGKAEGFEERAEGLHGSFYVPATREGDDALELVDSGVVDSFSVSFVPVRQLNRDGVTVRTEAGLREVSLVGMPAYAGAAIAGVRDDAPSPYAADVFRLRLTTLRTRYQP